MISDPTQLNAAILAAHEKHDTHRLAELYQEASRLKFAASDEQAGVFLLTHAYVFALESGHSSAKSLHQQLVALGREQIN